MNSSDNIFSVVSFNCWGIPIPFVVKDYKVRMNAICEALFTRENFDVICLQEVWSNSDFEFFKRNAEPYFSYSHYFHSGVIGSGLCVFSKWPILDVLFHKWQVNGYVHKVMHGDWYGGKGIGLCRLNVNGFKVNIYTCHTHAEYSENAEYIAHQVVQAFDVAQFIRVTSGNVDLSILAADLNSEPEELCYRIIKDFAGLTDSFELSERQWSGTFDCVRNSYANTRLTEKNPHGLRIDYILYKCGRNASVCCIDYDTPLDSCIPGKTFSYSDHEAIAAKFKFSTSNHSEAYIDSFIPTVQALAAVSEGYLVCEKAVGQLKREINFVKRILFLFAVLFCLILVTHFIFYMLSNLGLLLSVLVITFVVFIFFSVFIWKQIERNSILCSLNSMKISLNKQ